MSDFLAQADKLTMALVGVIVILVKDGLVFVKSLVTKNKVEERFHALEALMLEQVRDIRVIKEGVKYSVKADVPMQEKQLAVLTQLTVTLSGVQALLQAHEARLPEIKEAMDKMEDRLTKEIGRICKCK